MKMRALLMMVGDDDGDLCVSVWVGVWVQWVFFRENPPSCQS